uniref:Putative secreted protein n=1 Tax=Anopheles marajoara TaxID=58244 RepID=A0A2M4C9M9_9DIPT
MAPRKMAAQVRYRPWRGSHAVIMFFASNICAVSSGTVRARYCCEPFAVSGAKPGMKKCNRGNGTILTASLRKSAFSCPGNRKHVVTPDIVTAIK